MKSFSSFFFFLFLAHFSFAQNLVCPTTITTDSQAISDVVYMVETIEANQSSGPITPAPMVGSCIDFDALPAVSSGGTYKIYPEKDIDSRNGVSTLDIVIIARYLVGLHSLDAYQMLAADVDGNQSLDLFDLDLIVDLILYFTTSLTVPSWQFVDATVDPVDLAAVQKNFIEIDPANLPSSLDFYGVKSGDINGSSEPLTGSSEASDRGAETLLFTVEDRAVTAGETISVDFLAKDFTNLFGYQFTLNFNESVLEYQNHEFEALPTSGLLSFWNTEEADQGKIPNLWAQWVNMGTIPDDAVLFRITFKVLKNGLLSELLYASSEATKNLVIQNSSSETLQVALDFGTTTSQNEIPANSLTLFQNQPNPVAQSTRIPFQLEKAGEIKLLITDILGKTVKSIQLQGIKGEQAIELNRTDFGAPGLYHYTLVTESGQTTKAMIIK